MPDPADERLKGFPDEESSGRPELTETERRIAERLVDVLRARYGGRWIVSAKEPREDRD